MELHEGEGLAGVLEGREGLITEDHYSSREDTPMEDRASVSSSLIR